MTRTAHIIEREPTAELRSDERRARMATTSAAVAAAHNGALNRAVSGPRWERRGVLQRLVTTQ